MDLADAWGVARGYWDAGGTWRDAPPASVDAILAAMGATAEGPPPPGATVVREGSAEARGLPPGYHDVDDAAGGRLIVSPGVCPLPRPAWGWSAQLYATRSRHSWGIGDLADLWAVARWLAGQGAGLLLVNPLHAAIPALPQEPSPYFPSSRCFYNPLYIRIEDVPGADLLPDLAARAAAGRALNRDRRIDHDEVFSLKMDALEGIWRAGPPLPGFDAWRAGEGDLLLTYATFCALVEANGPDWRQWPSRLRRPDTPSVVRFRDERSDRVRFHQWLQWLCDRQLAAAAAAGVALVHDLAVGARADGADAWMWQHAVASGATVGAPPDEFNTEGQEWGFPPFDPWRLRACGYEPFIRTIRASLRHGGGLRVDHIMGVQRLYWIPAGAEASQGTYVRYPGSDLLDILALEASRAEAFVVGEDLGTVEDELRAEMARHQMLSYRLLWFEPGAPEAWPEQALAAVTTHDLPTVVGLWTGADLDAQRAIGLRPNEEGTAAIRRRLADAAGVDRQAAPDEAVLAAHRLLARAPAWLKAATLEDALSVVERPNMPGTGPDRWPNWSLALPVTLEELITDPRPAAIAAALLAAATEG